MTIRNSASRFIVACILQFVIVETAAGQTSATVTGAITDSTGGAIVGVQLTLQQAETGLVRRAMSAVDGRFVFAGVPVGQYVLRAEMAGFRTLVRQNVTLTVGQTLSLTLVMEVGGVEQTVNVERTLPTVNTQSPEVSFLVPQQAIESLPLNGRNYTDLTLLQPGVVSYPSRDGGSVVAHGLGTSVDG